MERARGMDVSNTVDVTDPVAVRLAVRAMLAGCYPDCPGGHIDTLFTDMSRVYRGRFPGYRACDVGYHNEQHVLDVTLAMARLIDGYHRRHPGGAQIDVQLALAGIAAALFHDSGYIRRVGDTRHRSGAAYTRVHVSRSARFLSTYLPGVGLGHLADACARLVQFTRHQVDPASLPVDGPGEFLVGSLLGTADLMAQMADAQYARKCRDSLYAEFVAGGLAGDAGSRGSGEPHYESPEQLLKMTPAFIDAAVTVRLDGQFDGVHRYAAEHFGGRHLYMDAIESNRRGLEAMLASGEFGGV